MTVSKLITKVYISLHTLAVVLSKLLFAYGI